MRQPLLMVWMANPVTGSQTVVGPAANFAVRGVSLYSGPGNAEIARLQRGCWCRRKGRGRFSLMWTEDATAVRFEDPANGLQLALGDFEMIGIVCDTIYVERENSRPVARWDERTGMWIAEADGRIWPEIVFHSALVKMPLKPIVPSVINGGVSSSAAFAAH